MIFAIQQNTITAYGFIWDGNGMEFVAALQRLEPQYSNIIVKLHTYGGSVFDGNLMFNALSKSKSKIELQIVGVAASMGAVLSLNKNVTVNIVANGFLMIHAPSGYTSGNAKAHESNAKLLRSIEKQFIDLLTSRTGKPESYVKKWLEGDNWFSATEAQSEGLVSGIIDSETEITAVADPHELGVEGVYNRFTALFIPDQQLQINNDPNMKKAIIAALALSGVTEQSSDTAVIEAVKEHYEGENTKLVADLKKEKEARLKAEGALKDQKDAEITALLVDGKAKGKFTADQEATYRTIGETAGIEALTAALSAIPERQTITGQMGQKGGPDASKSNWTFDQWQKEDPRGLEALAKENPEAFKELFDAKYKGK